MLNDRRQKVLESIIETYIESGQPVSSSALASKFGVSSATIRNEMFALEQMGFIMQPHISSGRVPTEMGYQFYIKNSLRKIDLPKQQKQSLEEVMAEKQEKLQLQLKSLAKLMADYSFQTVIVGFRDKDVFYTGISHLFSRQEFLDPERVQQMSRLFDQLNIALFEAFQEVGHDVEIFVGKNNPFGQNCSTLVTRYGHEENPGILAILGSMHMNYDYNISLLEYCKRIIEDK